MLSQLFSSQGFTINIITNDIIKINSNLCLVAVWSFIGFALFHLALPPENNFYLIFSWKSFWGVSVIHLNQSPLQNLEWKLKKQSKLTGFNNNPISVAPAERADILSKLKNQQKIILNAEPI